jgi:predicted RNase H-like HicB family nuclease
MKRTIQVHVFKGDELYVAECTDLGIVTQAASLDDLMANVREAIDLFLEDQSFAELGIVANPSIVATVELEAVA